MQIKSQKLGKGDALRLSRFYGAMTSLEAIISALSAEGVDVGTATAAALYTRGLDCHNLGGYAQLEKIADAILGIDAPLADEVVLDVGCGLGGPSRFIADRFGCRVVGVDLLPVRIDAARTLGEMTQSTERVDFRVADALTLPFGDAEPNVQLGLCRAHGPLVLSSVWRSATIQGV